MKKIFLIVTLSVAFQLEAKSQRNIDNQTNCDIIVTQYCVDMCSIAQTNNYLVNANSIVPIPLSNNCLSNPVVSEYFKVCWVVPNDQCDKDPSIPCAMVDGENAQGCGPNT